MKLMSFLKYIFANRAHKYIKILMREDFDILNSWV